MPQRIQLRRTQGWRKPEGAIVVARPTRWGNPFRVGDVVGPVWDCEPIRTRGQAVLLFIGRRDRAGYPSDTEIRYHLAGHDLACWCPLEDGHGNRVPCHADVLLEIANATR